MSENLIIYAGSKFGKAKKRLVEREAKKHKSSTSEFVWTAIRAALGRDSQMQLEAIEEMENGKGAL